MLSIVLKLNGQLGFKKNRLFLLVKNKQTTLKEGEANFSVGKKAA